MLRRHPVFATMLPTFRFFITVAVTGAWLLSASAQHSLSLHVAVAHAAPDHHGGSEPTHGHENVVVEGGDHSHAPSLDLTLIARNGTGPRSPQSTSAELPPAFAGVGPSTGPVVLDPEPNPPPHPLERHPSLRL